METNALENSGDSALVKQSSDGGAEMGKSMGMDRGDLDFDFYGVSKSIGGKFSLFPTAHSCPPVVRGLAL